MVHNKRKIIAIVTSVFMALTVWMIPTGFAAADDITEIEWTEGVTGGAIYFNKSTRTITKCDSAVTIAVIPSEIDGVLVKAIGDSAFRECDALTSVTIPDSVTVIKEHAFDDCSNLTDVAIPGSVTSIGDSAFRECDALTSVTLPDSILSIGAMAFYSCDAITSIDIPKSVTTIGDEAFNCCNYLNSLTVNADNINYSAENDVLFNKDKTLLIQYLRAKRKTSYSIPDTVREIGYSAFYNSSNLKSIWLPNNLESIADKAFCGCSSLTGITIPNGVTAIGNEAFASCSKLLTVAIPDSVTSIGNDAFKPCKSLISITVGDNNEYYASDNGVLYDKKQKALLLYPSANNNNSYVIPDGVMTIGKMAFYSCKSLTDVTIPDSVTSIGNNAFAACSALTSITIPDSVTSIGNNALDNCKSLTSITVDENNKYYSSKDGVLFNKDRTVLILYPRSNNRKSYIIPDSVTTIEDGAFESCEFLTGILIPDSVTSIEPNSFPWIETLTLFANKGSYAEQTLAEWVPFRTIITAAPNKVSTNLYKNHDTLKVSWSKVTGADGYYVYYKKSTWKSYQKLGTTTALSYSKAKLTDGAKYKFAVYPYMNIGDQKYRTKNGKSSDYVYTLKKLNKPGVKKSSRSYVRVSWNNIPGESGYQIARSKSSTKNFKIVKRVSKNYKSTKIKTPRYKKYYYKVRAYKTVNGKRIYGPWSSGKSYRLR
ncbi:MAG: leucine-rich repeat domain-containing protein [Bacillota bacterium]|nr:leucine-rich repeat domain-containing protein [Bacillota bacterium]